MPRVSFDCPAPKYKFYINIVLKQKILRPCPSLNCRSKLLIGLIIFYITFMPCIHILLCNQIPFGRTGFNDSVNKSTDYFIFVKNSKPTHALKDNKELLQELSQLYYLFSCTLKGQS